MGGNYKFVSVLCILAASIRVSDSANILGIFTSNSPSHQIAHMKYVKVLVERGYNVTVLTTIPLKDKNPKYHHIFIPPSEARVKQLADMSAMMGKQMGLIESVKIGVESVLLLGVIQADAIKDDRFQDFMNNPDNRFDLVIVGYFFNDFHVGIGVHFKCPVIMISADAGEVIANAPPSTMFNPPDLMTLKGILNHLFLKIVSLTFGTFIDMQMKDLYNENFPPIEYPSYKEAKKKVSLVLMDPSFTYGLIRPNIPALIEVDGIQIKEKPDPLPEDLQKICNASLEHGVIYLNLGSNITANDLNPNLFEIIFEALSGLKQTVLWKWDGAKTPGVSPNIHYRKWLPQDDLLAHPNVKLFITDAGKGSVTESQYHGVPMVALPMFADQAGNADKLEKDGFGLKVDQKTMTVESLRADVLEVLENLAYKFYVDQSSKETVVFWIEYVLMHKGAYHMRSALVQSNTWQYISADVIVIGLLLLVAFIVYKAIVIPTRFVLRKVFAKKSKLKTQ